mgnify:CR=1 FL=1
MKPTLFSPDATGRVVEITGGGAVTHAFIPALIPPQLKDQLHTWPILLEAHKALARLDGTGRYLPNANLILTPLRNREAQKSSSLEGTFTDPVQQALFQLDPTLPESATDPANAFREVFNYSKALKLRADTKEALPLSLRFIREIHRTLMTGVRGSDKNPGEFRKHQNQIGKPPRYVPPPPSELPGLLDNLEKTLHLKWSVDPLVAAFIVHYQFEAIHPFMDGNGRVGRLLLAICIAEWCGLADQWLYMSAYYDNNKDEYMDRLLSVSTKGDWIGWIDFSLRGVVAQAQDTQRRCETLVNLNRKYHEVAAVKGGSVRLTSIVDDLFVSPVVTVTKVAAKHKVTYPTARADLGRLERAGIIKELKGMATITYYCPEIFKAAHTD